MKKTCIASLIICIAFLAAYGQEKQSVHHLSYYKNDKKKKLTKAEVSIKIDNKNIVAKRRDNQYTFPIIDKNKEFTIYVKLNGREITAGPYKAFFLNNGSNMIFGELTRIKNLLSVAQYSDISEKDKDWESYSKRFFIINEAYTIDIDNYQTVKKLQFFIIAPIIDGDGVYSLT